MQVPLFGSVEKHRKDQPQKSKYIFHICHKEKVKHRLCRLVLSRDIWREI